MSANSHLPPSPQPLNGDCYSDLSDTPSLSWPRHSAPPPQAARGVLVVLQGRESTSPMLKTFPWLATSILSQSLGPQGVCSLHSTLLQ